MSTVNISLPKEQVTFVDKLVSTYGFANRSEFIRSVLRLLACKPDLIESTCTFPFVVPKEKSVKKIMADFKATKKYSPGFMKNLEKGMQTSKYFNK